MSYNVDISETKLYESCPQVLTTLLTDRTTGRKIFWATDSYAHLGAGYQYNDAITAECITGKNGMVIRPRALKSKDEQTARTKDMAEVFTPSWVCNKQNNSVDNVIFGRDNVFNTEVDNPDGTHTWNATEAKIVFPEGQTWQDYIKENRLEITCGEAPYLASRYDTVTGEPIPVEQRIGMLDRKLRIVNENTSTAEEWNEWALIAYQSVYGYEWQGDSLLLARESLFMTFVDYYRARFNNNPSVQLLKKIAYIVSWNIWQMDGLKGVIPDSCKNGVEVSGQDLFDDMSHMEYCAGCRNGSFIGHNGIYCNIRAWEETDTDTGEKGKTIRFTSLINRTNV